MVLDPNVTLVLIHHLSKGTTKLVHRLLDGGTFMLERSLITDDMDWVLFHAVLVFVVSCMASFPMSPFAQFHT